MPKTEELRAIVAENPLAPESIELLELLAISSDTRDEARGICFRALAQDSEQHRIRLLLARL